QVALTQSASGDLASGLTRNLTATVKDYGGNTVTGFGGTRSEERRGGEEGTVDFTGTAAATAVSGVATKQITGHTAGAVTLSAAVAGLLASIVLGVKVSVGAATQVALTQSASGDLASGLTRNLTATVKDYGGNTVTGFGGT